MTSKPIRSTKVHPIFAIMAGTAILGTVITFISTPWGVFTETDSYFYLSAAKNLMTGLGLGRLTQTGQFIPLTHYPPLYSLLIAGFSLFTAGNVLLSARILACLLFGGDSFIFGFLLARYTRNRWVGLAGTVLFLVSTVTINIIIAALSEGLFILFLLLALFCSVEFKPDQSKFWFYGACLFTALACLSRYVGQTVVIACLAGLVLHNQFPLRKKIKAASIFCATSLIPMLIWYLRDWLLTGSATNRILIYHFPDRSVFTEAISTVAGWFLPIPETPWISAILLLIVIIMGFFALNEWYQHRKSHQPEISEENAFRFAWILIIFIVTYGLSLLVSRTFLDASIRWNTRILSPVFVTAELLFFLVIWYGTRAGQTRWGKFILTAIGIYLVWINIPASIQYLNNSAQNGLGYTSKAMQKSPAIAELNKVAGRSFIYSNNAAAIYFNAGRLADWIPDKFDKVKGLPRDDFEQNLVFMDQELKTPGSLLVIFKPYQVGLTYPPLDGLTQGLVINKDFPDATFYGLPNY